MCSFDLDIYRVLTVHLSTCLTFVFNILFCIYSSSLSYNYIYYKLQPWLHAHVFRFIICLCFRVGHSTFICVLRLCSRSYICLPICLSVCLPVCLPACLSPSLLSLSVSVCISMSITSLHLSVCLSFCRSVCLSGSVCSPHVSVCISLCIPSSHLSAYIIALILSNRPLQCYILSQIYHNRYIFYGYNPTCIVYLPNQLQMLTFV